MSDTDANATGERRHATPAPMRWLLLTGDRLAVAGAVLGGVAALFVGAGILGLATVTTPSRVMWYLNGTVNGLLTLVPISVGVNQIVLSQELGSIQDLYERRKEIGEFRQRVESQTDTAVSSPRASAFSATLLSAVAETAASFRREYRRGGDRSTDDIERYVRSVVAEAEATRDRLPEDEYDMLGTLLVMVQYGDSLQFHETRRLNDDPNVDLSDEAAAKLDELEELFVEIDAVRQYLKTVVIERQLARLSRLLVFTGVPAVAVAALGIFTYRDVAGLELSHAALVLIAGSLVAVSLVPLAILSAYILRVATIARRTAAFGPFVPQSDHEPLAGDGET